MGKNKMKQWVSGAESQQLRRLCLNMEIGLILDANTSELS